MKQKKEYLIGKYWDYIIPILMAILAIGAIIEIILYMIKLK